MPKRYDANDTVDTATHLLHRLAADGLVVKSIKYEVDYTEPSEKHALLPLGATIVIELTPVIDRK